MTQRNHRKALLSIHLLRNLSSVDSSVRLWCLHSGGESLCGSYHKQILLEYPFKKRNILRVPFNPPASLNYKHSICQAWFSSSQFIETVAGSTLCALPGSRKRKCSFFSLYLSSNFALKLPHSWVMVDNITSEWLMQSLWFWSKSSLFLFSSPLFPCWFLDLWKTPMNMSCRERGILGSHPGLRRAAEASLLLALTDL